VVLRLDPALHRDDFWRQFSIRDRYASVKVPVLHFEGWYDAFLDGGTENFTGMVAHGGTELARDNQRLVVGPWDHVNWGRSDSTPAPLLKDIGPVGDSPINSLMLAWFDHFLKGRQNDVADKPRSTISSWVPTRGKPRGVGLCHRRIGRRSISTALAVSRTARADSCPRHRVLKRRTLHL
jgi:putative CocE/NonD family hydrolase